MTHALTLRTACALLAGLATGGTVAAQPLSPAMCPAGSPFTYAIPNMRPPIAGDIPMLRHTIDQTIAALLASDPGPLRVQGLTAATGLRLGLFPPNAVAANAAAP